MTEALENMIRLEQQYREGLISREEFIALAKDWSVIWLSQ